MGIAASYTMHLYCDCRQCTDGKYQSPDFGEYIGTSWAGCAKEARKDGWRISADKTGNDSNLLIVFYVQIMPDDFVMQLHRF